MTGAGPSSPGDTRSSPGDTRSSPGATRAKRPAGRSLGSISSRIIRDALRLNLALIGKVLVVVVLIVELIVILTKAMST